MGSAMLLLTMVPGVDHPTMKSMARKIAINTIFFLLIVQITGAYMLRFFGISLPVVQVAGGLVLAAMGWSLLNAPDPEFNPTKQITTSPEKLTEKLFYPLTFPITAGPGAIVVALTLSAHASDSSLMDAAFAQLGLLISVVLIGVVVYVCYAWAETMRSQVSPGFTQGVLRVISFILLCIGSEIMWTGIQNLVKSVL